MYRFVFDTETDGLPNDRELPDHPSQPHLVQLAAMVFDEQWVPRATYAVIIKPDGWTIPDEVVKIHGISTELAIAVGVPLVVALASFNHLARACNVHIAHNTPFDMKIITTAYHRAGRAKQMVALNCKDTMQMALPILKIPPTEKMVKAGFGHKFKNPNLTECVRFFFNEELEGAHDALCDVKACARIYKQILELKSFTEGLGSRDA
jgi:DNA polymerase-3 subunit epsilon